MKKTSLILALILIIASIGCVPSGIAFAASETVYTGVLEDLQKDETFDVSNYPSKDRFDLQLINLVLLKRAITLKQCEFVIFRR